MATASKRNLTFKALIIALILPLILCVLAKAQQSAYIPYQGELADQTGNPLSPATPVTLVFRLYEVPTLGPVLWEEVQPKVMVTNGRFSLLLGTRVPFPSQKIFSRTLYLGITIDDGDAATTDVEMRPRQAVVPVVYATNSGNAERLAGYDWSSILVGGSTDPTTSLIRGDRIDLRAINDEIVKLRTELKRDNPPIGTIMAFGGTEAPDGWLLCDGRTIILNDQPEMRPLFGVIKNTFGGTALVSFSLPDLRGRVAMGSGQGPGLSARSLGQILGEETHKLSGNELPVHSHHVPDHWHLWLLPGGGANFATGGSYNSAVLAGNGGGMGADDPRARPDLHGGFRTDGVHGSNETSDTLNIGTAAAGQNTIQPSLVVNYIIKYK